MPRWKRSGPPALLVLTTLLLAGSVRAANADYAKAAADARQKMEALQSYDLSGMLSLANKAKGGPDGPTATARIATAARWPDRLLSIQEGDMMNVNLGTGAASSW